MSTPPSSPNLAAGRLAPLAALRYRDFVLLWLGQLVSICGSQMRIVAVNVQIYQLAKAGAAIDPALALGLIGLARAVPLVLTAPLSGLVADRMDRRTLLVLTSLGALVASAVLALASGFEQPSIWLIYAMVIFAAVVGAFEMPARQALIPSLVPAAVLPNALSLNIIAWQVATILGPTLAGILIAWGGVAPVYWIDAASFLAVVLAAALMRTHSAPPRGQPVTLGAALEGLRFVFRSPLIASTMLLDFLATFFGAAMTLLPLFADQVLHVGPVELGWMYAAPSAGAVLAALALTSVRIPRQGPVLLWSIAIFGLCTAIFGLSRSLPLTLLALAGTGASDTVSMVIRGTIRQLLTPDDLRGRMTAVNMIFFAGGPQLGEFESGVAASLLGGPAAVLLGGGLCVAMVGAVAGAMAICGATTGRDKGAFWGHSPQTPAGLLGLRAQTPAGLLGLRAQTPAGLLGLRAPKPRGGGGPPPPAPPGEGFALRTRILCVPMPSCCLACFVVRQPGITQWATTRAPL